MFGVSQIDPNSGVIEDFYYTKDHVNSVIEIRREDQSLLRSYEYTPFGVTGGVLTSLKNTRTYTSREQELEASCFYYYRARYYDACDGRFISEDPIGLLAGDINFYRYVNTNPINASDPNGLIGPLATGAIGAVIGGISGFVSASISGGSIAQGIAVGAATGFGIGSGAALFGFTGSAGLAAIGGAIGGFTSNITAQTLTSEVPGASQPNLSQAGIAALTGAASGGLSSILTGGFNTNSAQIASEVGLGISTAPINEGLNGVCQ